MHNVSLNRKDVRIECMLRLAADMIARHTCASNVEANAMRGHNPKKNSCIHELIFVEREKGRGKWIGGEERERWVQQWFVSQWCLGEISPTMSWNFFIALYQMSYLIIAFFLNIANVIFLRFFKNWQLHNQSRILNIFYIGEDSGPIYRSTTVLFKKSLPTARMIKRVWHTRE